MFKVVYNTVSFVHYKYGDDFNIYSAWFLDIVISTCDI